MKLTQIQQRCLVTVAENATDNTTNFSVPNFQSLPDMGTNNKNADWAAFQQLRDKHRTNKTVEERLELHDQMFRGAAEDINTIRRDMSRRFQKVDDGIGVLTNFINQIAQAQGIVLQQPVSNADESIFA